MRSVIQRLVKLFPQSLIAEIIRIFGPDLADKFLLIFGGTTIKIPSTREIREMEVSLAIYDTLKNAKSRAESRRLCTVLGEQHHLKRKEVREFYRHTKQLLKEADAVTEADARTGQHQKPRIRRRRKK